MFLCGSGQVHVLQVPRAPCSSLCYTFTCLNFGFVQNLFLTCFCQISVQFLEAPKLVLIIGVYKSVPAPCGENRPGHQACSQLLSLFSFSFVHYSTFASLEGPFHWSFSLCSLLSTQALIFFPFFSFSPQPLSCLLPSPFQLLCREMTPCTTCTSSVRRGYLFLLSLLM